MTSHEIGDSMFFVETIPAVIVDKKYSTVQRMNKTPGLVQEWTNQTLEQQQVQQTKGKIMNFDENFLARSVNTKMYPERHDTYV